MITYVFFIYAFSAYRFLVNLLPLAPSSCSTTKSNKHTCKHQQHYPRTNQNTKTMKEEGAQFLQLGATRTHLPGLLRALVHLARLALALALLVVQAPAMALLVQLYMVSLRLQPTRAREKNQHKIFKNKQKSQKRSVNGKEEEA